MLRRPVLTAFAPRTAALGASVALAGGKPSLTPAFTCTAAQRLAATAPPKPAKFTDPDMTHFRHTATPHPLYKKPAVVDPKTGEFSKEWTNPAQNTVWTPDEVREVQRTHRKPRDAVDAIALLGIKTLRFGFDLVSGYLWGRLTPTKILRRVLFLETAAGIPGMVAGTLRHLKSLRRMQRDYGWIHTLLEEAENERMHMLVFMKSYRPGPAFRGMVLLTQGVFWNVFFLAYLASPRLCHRFVGYLEEEAVRTYSHIIDVMQSSDPRDADVVAFGKQPAQPIAIRYWKLPEDATMFDVVLAVRADEANHRDVNHTFASMKANERNPFLDHRDGPAAKHAPPASGEPQQQQPQA